MVLLDDLVLNVTKFMDEHPGGKFSIQHNIGRDISKFFYGGYALENQKSVPAHTHSNDARKIVNSLIIGRLESSAPVQMMKISSSAGSANKSGSAKTFKFTTVQP